MTNSKNMHVTKRYKCGGTGMEDFFVLWIFCGNSHMFFCGYDNGCGD